MKAALRKVAPAPTPDEQAIARTVVYASLFDYPLTLAEVRESLMESVQSESDILATYRRSAWLHDAIEYREGFFFPAARHDLIAVRERREQFSLEFLDRHRRVLRAICALPFVRMVAISGSLAHLNLEADGDLDLFVIARGRHVWSVTVAIVLLAKAFGCRRTVCANFVLADSRLAVGQPDLFTANQVIHLKPIAGAELFPVFVRANRFVADYYPNFTPRTEAVRPFAVKTSFTRVKRALEVLLAAPAFGVEAFCRRAYLWHLRRRSASWRSPQQVTLDPDCVKLHTRSHRAPVLARFDAAVTETLGCEP